MTSNVVSHPCLNDTFVYPNSTNDTSKKNISMITSITLFCAISGLVVGWDLCVIAIIINDIGSGLNLCPNESGMCFKKSFLVAVISFGAMIGSITGGILADKFGRRTSLFLSDIYLIVGSFYFYGSTTYESILISRIIIGFGIGTGFVVFSTYISEISPPSTRGAHLVLIEFAQCLGFLAVSISSYLKPNIVWHNLVAIPGFISLVHFFLIYFMPESPHWLLLNDQKEKGLLVAKYLSLDMTEIVRNNNEQLLAKDTSSIIHILKSNIGILKLACFIGIVQNILFSNAIFAFSGDIFFLSYSHQIAFYTFMWSLAKIIGILTVIQTVDKYGRDILLFLGTLIYGLSCFVMGLSHLIIFIYNLHSVKPLSEYITIFDYSRFPMLQNIIFWCIFVIMYAWEISWASLTFVVASELLPSTIRGAGLGIVSFCYWLSYLISQLLFEYLLEHFLILGTFLFIFSLSFVILLIVNKYIPDSTGKSLELYHKISEESEYIHTPEVTYYSLKEKPEFLIHNSEFL